LAAHQPARKLSYNEQRELAALPARIDELESEHRALRERIASPDFYKEPSDAIHAALARAEQLDADVIRNYARWEELDAKRQGKMRPCES
jgi:ATP-binding cassette subfamily F protein uup